jgi:hypothetical protein
MDHRKAGDHEAKDCASRIAARRFRSPSQLSLSSRVWEPRPPKIRRWVSLQVLGRTSGVHLTWPHATVGERKEIRWKNA